MEIVQGKKRQETDAPWIGLTAEGPLQWVITVRETVDDREKVQDFVIAAVMGDEEVRWAESGVQRNVRIFGMLLAQATLLTAVALGFVSAPQTWSLDARTITVLDISSILYRNQTANS